MIPASISGRNAHAFEPLQNRPLPTDPIGWGALSVMSLPFEPIRNRPISSNGGIWKVLPTIASPLFAPINQICIRCIWGSKNDTSPAGLPSNSYDINKCPRNLRTYLLTFLDLPELAKFSTLSKDWNAIVASDLVWESVARRINCPLHAGEGTPYHKQVMSFIENSKKNAFSLNADIMELLNVKGPTIAQINHLQKWLKAERTLAKWDILFVEVKGLLPGLNLEDPGIIIPSQEMIAKAGEYSGWRQANRDVLKAKETLVVWCRLAAYANLNGPELHTLNTEEAVIDRAREFSGWFNDHREALVQLSELKLSGKGLTSLPKEIWSLTQLQKLDLSHNELTLLPSEIGNLTQLQELYLDDNQLTSLPTEIAKLIRLTNLSISSNQLTELPPKIGKLTGLEVMRLGGNRLRSLPDWIGNLTKLAALWVNDTQLTFLPSWIGNLTQLKRLGLYMNKLTELPSEIGNLTQLQELYLDDNQLTSLSPEIIGKLTQLQTLNLHNNQLTSFPIKIGDLTQLISFGINGNLLPLSTRIRLYTLSIGLSMYDTAKENSRKIAATAVTLTALGLGAYLGYATPLVTTALSIVRLLPRSLRFG